MQKSKIDKAKDLVRDCEAAYDATPVADEDGAALAAEVLRAARAEFAALLDPDEVMPYALQDAHGTEFIRGVTDEANAWAIAQRSADRGGEPVWLMLPRRVGFDCEMVAHCVEPVR